MAKPPRAALLTRRLDEHGAGRDADRIGGWLRQWWREGSRSAGHYAGGASDCKVVLFCPFGTPVRSLTQSQMDI
jgi:hypothetical protein